MRLSVEDIMSSFPIMANTLSLPASQRMDAPVRKKRSESASATQEHTRQQNALRARRSYHRRQLEQLSMQEHSKVYTFRNKDLREDNTRLEQCLAMAKQCVAENVEAKSLST